MNPRQKRSSGGYGLRRKIAKKRLDEDFEYYYSKIGSNFDSTFTRGIKEESDNLDIEEKFVTEAENVKPYDRYSKTIESPGKRPRGRPRKVPLDIPTIKPDLTDTTLRLVDLKEKRSRKPRILSANEKLQKNYVEIIGSVVQEEIIETESIVQLDRSVDEHVSSDLTDLHEEEVSSLPEGKENLPEEVVHLEADSVENVIVQLEPVDPTDGDIYETGTIKHENTENKQKRKYRRSRLSQDTIHKLSQLHPEDKIECNECHKLLKPSSYRQHLRTHTGAKPFGCDLCDARFTRKGDVERHVRIVHNKQKPFKCCRCQRAFGDKKNLRWHLMNHDKKLFYVCEVCGFKFGKREYWENHVRFLHPGQAVIDTDEYFPREMNDRIRVLAENLLDNCDSAVEMNIEDESASEAAVRSIQHGEYIIEEEDDETSVHVPVISPMQTVLKSFNVSGKGSEKAKMSLPRIISRTQPQKRLVAPRNGTIEAVVIQFDESGTGTSTVQSLDHIPIKGLEKFPIQVYQQADSRNVGLVHVVSPHDVVQVVQDDEHCDSAPIIIDTNNFTECYDEATESMHDQILEVSVCADDNDSTGEYEDTDCDSKTIIQNIFSEKTVQ